MPSKIAWTEEVWNPLAGCSHCSPGCDGCYAARLAFGRLAHTPTYAGLALRRTPHEQPRFTGEIRFLPEKLDQPLRWRRSRLIFVNSMSDLFHPSVPFDFIVSVWATMAAAQRHTFQLLTKRPANTPKVLNDPTFARDVARYVHDHGLKVDAPSPYPIENVWLGTSIENNRYAFRASQLRSAKAALHWLSFEPLLGPVPDVNLAGIGWVVVGGESGPGARPMDPQWVRDIRDRCAEAQVPFFMKQAGAVLAREWGMRGAGHVLEEMPEDLRIRQYPRRSDV